MRAAAGICLLLCLATGCVTSVAPRQYLDEETAATITAVARPWIFAVGNQDNVLDRRGYLSLHALDVNRTGTHKHYLAAMQSSFDITLPDEKLSTPILEVQAGDRKLVFQSAAQNPRQLGIAKPLEQPLALESRWWYFAVSKEDLAAIAQLQRPRITLIAKDARFTYVEFRNGSKELTELSATL
jgi:hypothetical protein